MIFPKAMETSSAISYNMANFGPNWIIQILPYLEEQPLYDSFDLTRQIDDAVNSKNWIARGTTLPVLLCPSDATNNRVPFQGIANRYGDPNGNWARTNYAANAGRGDIWGTNPPTRNSGPDSPHWKAGCRRGVMGPNTSVKVGRIVDGTSKTIMIGEIRTGLTPKDARGVWAFGHVGTSLVAGYGAGGDDNGPNVCNAVNKEDDVMSDVCNDRNAMAQCMSCDPGYFAQATVRSVHTGGAYLGMCDGSVQFVSDDIETSGAALSSKCCSPWDYMIASADEGRAGLYNGGTATSGCD
jgi:hypothetical protein